MIDNPFGTRQDPGWRLYMKDIPHYDLHVVQRDANIADYQARGARDVIKIQTAYEPTIHFPPPRMERCGSQSRSVVHRDAIRSIAQRLLDSAVEECLPVAISGNELAWKRALVAEAVCARSIREGELYGQQYREGIWRSKINLSFLTQCEQDEFAHKSFEIAACEGFLLAERSEGHLQRFGEDEEAVFFSDD